MTKPLENLEMEAAFNEHVHLRQRTVWHEAMVREGCICGHGQYDHNNLGTVWGQCRACECPRLQRDHRGNRCRHCDGCLLVVGHHGDCAFTEADL